MKHFKALWVTETPEFKQQIIERSVADLPEGELLIKVEYSCLNYKDALSASGNRGVTKHYPHTPGIDAAGTVVESSVADFQPGTEVIVTGYDLGMNTAGGLAGYIRVPAAWAIKRPVGLTAQQAMSYGTAGLTAGLCINKLLKAGLMPEQGTVLVTGATGGVGSIAVALLSKLGFKVAAVTGKAEQAEWLQSLGAEQVLSREQLAEGLNKPLLRPLWAGVVDTVGGDLLFNAIKALNYGASAACCGLTAGVNFDASVLPFILRGVNLLGVDSVELPLAEKQAVWDKLATEWSVPALEQLVTEISLEQVPAAISQILSGLHTGRMLVKLADH
ncbi:quinone oxidoreductase [Thiopseudomonas alkaliphila]|uniref:YhdH/YhfP family quinone oxidoreductase n=1 Tax=Thiopseudomonas alkaliphila TaxID=1697053 RepID=UPI00069FA6DD|nr:YhdH/YhfP family quinone oxidoreductase [Thiopseudomonas alkaliphila]AKX46580.1 quinone oxidoreductase [Thiopseudomonas alkaliphila]